MDKILAKVPFGEKVGYSLGDAAANLVFQMMMIYQLKFYTDVFGLEGAVAGTVLLIARIVDAFVDPTVGILSDKTQTRWGKFRPWILIGTLVNSVIAILLFTNPVHFFDLSMGQAMAYCAVFYILWGMSYTIMDIPYWSFIPAFSESPYLNLWQKGGKIVAANGSRKRL